MSASLGFHGPPLFSIKTEPLDFRALGVSNGFFEHLRAERLFLRARAVINFLMRAASTFEITNGGLRALCKLSVVFAPRNLADTFQTGQQAQS